MTPENLPTIDARYWTAILAASMCGANTGDFASRILGLGHTRGLIPLALVFLVDRLGREAKQGRDRSLLLARDHRAAHRRDQSGRPGNPRSQARIFPVHRRCWPR